ncbi:hypothetical protein HMPREF9248_0835 [Fannyhessea vaginae PB189-T1-4]|uniref:Uncharacterized protein n=1 Tax=Fannyhessea vaginae PB189-T1-4 TaxID=866774 RepID=A0ABP2IZD2_9ACTN|nr:hypothetical protein HMPREF9248_0835 [Fannyhessea vaginae PB189-T1-4]
MRITRSCTLFLSMYTAKARIACAFLCVIRFFVVMRGIEYEYNFTSATAIQPAR